MQDQLKMTKIILLISVTMFLAIISIVSLIFVMKLRNDPNFVKEVYIEKKTPESSPSSADVKVETPPVDENPLEGGVKEDFSNIKKETLEKVKNSYNEYVLDEF